MNLHLTKKDISGLLIAVILALIILTAIGSWEMLLGYTIVLLEWAWPLIKWGFVGVFIYIGLKNLIEAFAKMVAENIKK